MHTTSLLHHFWYHGLASEDGAFEVYIKKLVQFVD